MVEVGAPHFEDLVFREIKLMKGLSRTAASGLVGGVAGALMSATAFTTRQALEAAGHGVAGLICLETNPRKRAQAVI